MAVEHEKYVAYIFTNPRDHALYERKRLQKKRPDLDNFTAMVKASPFTGLPLADPKMEEADKAIPKSVFAVWGDLGALQNGQYMLHTGRYEYSGDKYRMAWPQIVKADPTYTSLVSGGDRPIPAHPTSEEISNRLEAIDDRLQREKQEIRAKGREQNTQELVTLYGETYFYMCRAREEQKDDALFKKGQNVLINLQDMLPAISFGLDETLGMSMERLRHIEALVDGHNRWHSRTDIPSSPAT